MAKEQGEEGRVVAVTAHDREREVLVSVPMEGFPEGFKLQDATVVATQDSPEASGAGDVVWVVESQDPEGPDQVIAVRRGRPRRE